MEKLECQGCDGTGRSREPDYDGSGCAGCGGFGHVAVKSSCYKCGREGWFPTRAISMYEGRRYRSIDGLVMVFRYKQNIISNRQICLRCDHVSGGQGKGIEGEK